MTRQDYILLAKAIAQLSVCIARHDSASRSSREATRTAETQLIFELIAAFQRDNEKFDVDRFKEAIANEAKIIIETSY